MSDTPDRILAVGDLHGNPRWTAAVIREAAVLLPAEPCKLILQVGDYGIWPGLDGTFFRNAVIGSCRKYDVRVRFLDGNHEDFSQIEQFRVTAGDDRPMAWLPRGHRWSWHGRTWLACGGAVSLDRAARTEGRDWWPEEEITDEQEAEIIAGGHADVLASHDCPAGVRHSFPDRPSWWDQRDLDRSDAHRERLQRIVDAVRPAHIIHGHLHKGYSRRADFGYGPVQVTGLAADGSQLNYAVLNVRDMEWEAR